MSSSCRKPSDFYSVGVGPGQLLSYGTFPDHRRPGEFIFPAGVVLVGDAVDKKGGENGRNSADAAHHARIEQLDSRAVVEHIRHSWFRDGNNGGAHPSDGRTEPDESKEGAYSGNRWA